MFSKTIGKICTSPFPYLRFQSLGRFVKNWVSFEITVKLVQNINGKDDKQFLVRVNLFSVWILLVPFQLPFIDKILVLIGWDSMNSSS